MPSSHHTAYYIDDDPVIFLVEDVLFKVPRFVFKRDSEPFRHMFSTPTSSDPEGLTDENPIRLDGVSHTDFERLLWLLYPQKIGEHQPKTIDEWSSIAVLARKWMFDDVLRIAIEEVKKIPDPIGQVILGRKIGCEDLLHTGYLAFAQRTRFLRPEEAKKLGRAEILNLTRFRELSRMSSECDFKIETPSEELRVGGILSRDFTIRQLFDRAVSFSQKNGLDLAE